MVCYNACIQWETILNTEQGMGIIFGVRCIYMLRALNIKRLDFIGFMELYRYIDIKLYLLIEMFSIHDTVTGKLYRAGMGRRPILQKINIDRMIDLFWQIMWTLLVNTTMRTVCIKFDFCELCFFPTFSHKKPLILI